MSFRGLDNEFLFAIRTAGPKRSNRELDVIYSRLRHLDPLSNWRENALRELCSVVRFEFHEANEILYRKDDPCQCWYILLSGSVFIQGSMFLPYHSFGKQIPGTKRRGCQCLVLEPSEMLAIDYPDMAIHTSASSLSTRPHAMRRGSASGSTDRLSGDNLTEPYSSSSESSPTRNSRASSLPKTSNGQAMIITADTASQSSLSKDLDDDDDYIEVMEEGDSLSLHSSSSFLIKDLVIEVLKKDVENRTQDDIDMLMDFTKSLGAFSNMTESVRKSLCKAMVFAWVEHANTVVLKDNELLDSWSVIINGQVQIRCKGVEKMLVMGDTFGVEANMEPQHHQGIMTTLCDDCQFLCIPQPVYCELMQLGQENIELLTDESGCVVTVKEKRDYDNGTKSGNILIRGTVDSLMHHMLEENALDTTFIEDFLLTYRAFSNEPLRICKKLLEWFDNEIFRSKVIRILLLWVNNHFNDFERSWNMMKLLEEFEEKLNDKNLQGQTKLLSIACTTKAKPRIIMLSRPNSDQPLGFEIAGGSSQQGNCQPIYIESVVKGSVPEAKGLKRGDQILDLNGQNFEKLSFKEALTILNKNTELSLTLKTNLFSFKDTLSEKSGTPQRRSKKGKHHSLRENRQSLSLSSSTDEVFDGKMKKSNTGTIGRATRKLSRMFKKETNYEEYVSIHSAAASQMTVDDSFLSIPSRLPKSGSSATLDLTSHSFRHFANLSHSNPDLLEPVEFDFLSIPAAEAPEDVIKIYKSDQTFKFMYVNDDTTAKDAVAKACKEFSITENLEEYALYRINVQGTSFVKQSKLPDAWSKLADIPLGSRYYLKNTMNSDQLLPDENIPDLLKEANFSFLDLNCFEVALYLTREDYRLFQLTEPTNFIDDLFHGDSELLHFKKFEDLVNRELFWVVTTICNESSALQRSKIIKHFTKIAHHCKVLKNFNSTFALVSGLGYRAVSRLKQTWEKVPTKSVRLLKELQALMDPSRNMSKYRTLLNDYIHQPPVIPYIPVVKKDLTFLHLGNDTKVNGLINFEKMRMIAKEVRNVCRLCAPDKSQIIPSAVVSQQKEPDKGTIYQTLIRRGRRASFNNVRRIYEDQMNVRRVKQYMKLIDDAIVTDEEKLMELSKQIEPPAAVSSAQVKRRNTSVSVAVSSPSRTSKTLPNQPGRNSSTSSLQSRNNSEPQLANIPGLTTQPVKKKTMSSTLPKYGSAELQSPQMISRKLMSLSEESGGDERRYRGKKMKDTKRSASVSSHEISPPSSPYMTPAHQHDPSKMAPSANHTNNNNKRHSMHIPPPSGDSAHLTPMNVFGGNKKSLAPHMGNSASCRSSIASTSSLGTMSSSNPSTSSLVGNGSSPRSSSPISWGSSSSIPYGVPSSSRFQHSNSPSRSASGSSADTVKAAGENSQHERPIIKQSRNTRSGSYGGVNVTPSSMNERILSQMTASNSSPTLNANRNQPLILPNHPRIPRTPSIDSGVLSGSSLSADSVRYNPSDESEQFGRVHAHYFPQTHHQVPMRSSAGRTAENTAATNRRSQHMRSMSVDQQSTSRQSRSQGPRSDEEKTEKVEQTFLFGCRGQWGAPRPENEVPINLLLPGATNPAEYGGKVPPDLLVHPGHIPPGMKVSQSRHPGSRSVLGKSVVKNIHDFVIFERQSFKHSHPFYRNVRGYDHNPIMQPNFINTIRSTTSEDMLEEEQLVLELRKQKPKQHNTKRLLHYPPEQSANLANLKRMSFIQPEPPIDETNIWPFSQSGTRVQLPSPQSHYPPERIMMPQEQSQFPLAYHQSHAHQYRTSPQTVRPTSLGNTPKAYRGLNPTEASAIAAYDAMQYNGWPQGGDEVSSPIRNCEVPNSLVLNSSDQSFYDPHRRHSGHFPPSPMTNGPVDPSFYDQMQNERLSFHQYPPSPHPIESSSSPYPPEMGSGYRVSCDVPDGVPERGFVSHARRKSQEWNETDLDSDRQYQAIKAWGSSASLPGSPITSQLPPRGLHPELLQKPSSETKANKAPAPPPPLRTSSRAPNKTTTGSNSPVKASAPVTDKAKPVRHSLPAGETLQSLKANGHLPNGLIKSQPTASPASSSSCQDRRSLPSYNEALQQINAKHVFPAQLPIKNSYNNISCEKSETKEQISQV